MLFVFSDDQYKRMNVRFDAVRGILWCETFEKDQHDVHSHHHQHEMRKSEASQKLRREDENEASANDKRKAKNGGSPVEIPAVDSPLHPMHPQAPAAMVPWFSTIIAQTAFQLFIGSNLNFLSFDFRTLERTMYPKVFTFLQPKTPRKGLTNMQDAAAAAGNEGVVESAPGVSASLPSSLSMMGLGAPSLAPKRRLSMEDLTSKEEQRARSEDAHRSEDVWFDFVADVGDGFNSTYEMARLLAQPSLRVPQDKSTGRFGYLRDRILSNLSSGKKRLWRIRDAAVGGKGGAATKRSASADARSPSSSSSSTQQRMSALSKTPLVTSEKRRHPAAAPITGGSFALPESSIASLSRQQKNASSSSSIRSSTSDDDDEDLILPRGRFVVIGGDLAYPNPSNESYAQRLFGPYGDALPMDRSLREAMQKNKRRIVEQHGTDPDVAHITLPDPRTVAMHHHREEDRKKRGISPPSSSPSATQHEKTAAAAPSTTDLDLLRSTPLLFAIPGNHDWIDGLNTFRERILGKSWMGSWYMPQTTSYFILALPENWFLFCLDTGLFEDIDTQQLAYFFEAIDTRLKPDSSVVLVSHEPAWIHQQIRQPKEILGPKVAKIAKKLGPRLRARLCGDVHNYSRHVAADPLSTREMLIVSGGGGAFLHGPRPSSIEFDGTLFKRAAAFPARNDFLTIATRLFGFRIVNWQFDLIGGILYFVTIASILPLPFADAYHRAEDGLIASSLSLTAQLVLYILSESTFSCIICIGLTIIFLGIMEDKLAAWKRISLGLFWAWLHIFAAVFLMSLLHTSAISMHRSKFVVSTRDVWGSMMDRQLASSVGELVENVKHFLPVNSTAAHAVMDALHTDTWYHTSPAAVFRFMIKLLDVLEGLIYFSMRVASDRVGEFAPSASRVDIIMYYGHTLWFYWLLATPVVSVIVGAYLMVSITVFDTAYDPAYSAFQIEDYKHFLRFKLSAATRELHCYVVGVRKVHKVWERDPQHTDEHDRWPFFRAVPSVWRPVPQVDGKADCAPRLIESFAIQPTPQQHARSAKATLGL